MFSSRKEVDEQSKILPLISSSKVLTLITINSKSSMAVAKTPTNGNGKPSRPATNAPKIKRDAGGSLFFSMTVAVAAFVLGIASPTLYQRCLLLHQDYFPAVSSRRVQERVPKYSCTDDLLQDFFQDNAVAGFHIVCFERDDAQLQVTSYRDGMRSWRSQSSIDYPASWSLLKSLLVKHLQLTSADVMHQPWAMFSLVGQRILDETLPDGETAASLIESLSSDFGIALIYQGGQFLWPGVRVGFEREVSLYSVMPMGSPEFGADKNTTVTLETLSIQPLVLSVQGFLSNHECRHIQEVASPSMKYSDVVLMDHDKGREASDFRTSQTTFLHANNDAILTDIDHRTASLVRLPKNHQEQVQVLRYGNTERYTSHHDYFDPSLYKTDKRTLSLIKNGRRNRMATVFWYLSDVESGGETVFPRFNGGRERSFEDCETGLKVKPETGKVIIFYSLDFRGQADPSSLHGACRVKEGTKWAANKWVWNEPMRYVSL